MTKQYQGLTLKEAMNKMIKPGTLVRCRDENSDEWTDKKWFYVGKRVNGQHVAEDKHGGIFNWTYVEPLPRELKKGDRVLVSDESLDKCTIEGYEFDGMYGGQYICKSMGFAEKTGFLSWKYAVHVDDAEINND